MTIAALLATLTLHIGAPVNCAATLPIPNTVGVTDLTARQVYLRADVCARLQLIANGARPRSISTQRDFAEALWTVGHEWARIDGINDEPASDCAGVVRMVAAAGWLGVRVGYARELRGYADAALMREGCP